MKRTILTTLVFLFAACTPGYYQQQDKVSGSTEVLNYEYTNAYYASELRNTHFTVNVLILEPYVVSFPQKNFGKVHSSGEIDAVAICDVSIRADGSVENYVIRKSAGVGLDRYTNELLNSMKFKPLSYKGSDYPSKFRIVLHYTK